MIGILAIVLTVEYNMLDESRESKSSKIKIFAISQSSQILCLFFFFYKTNGQRIMQKLLCLNVYITKSIFHTSMTILFHHHHDVTVLNILSIYFILRIKKQKEDVLLRSS